jgi:hypothetical protein
MKPLEGKRQAIVINYLPTNVRIRNLTKRLQVMRARCSWCKSSSLQDYNALACAYALGADGVVIDVK